MQKLNRRERVMVLVAVLFVLGAVILQLSPGSGKTTNAKLLTTDQAERQYRQDRNKYIAMGQEQDDLAPRLQKIAYDDSAEQLIPKVVRELQLIAEKSGVHLQEVRPLRPKALPSGLGMRIPLEVHFKATFQPYVVRFLYHVEDPTGRMVVDKVDVTSSEAKFKTVNVNAVISVFTRSLTDDTNTGQGDASDATQATSQG